MKPRNFPERVNQRRKSALARLLSKWPNQPTFIEERERRALESRIVPDARSARSKVRRGDNRGRLNAIARVTGE